MPSYPLRPTFPVDVRSPSGTVKVGRVGTAVTVDLDPAKVFEALPISTGQLFAALDVLYPGASATVRDAVPSDVASPINRAYRTTAFVTADSALLAFVAQTLSLTNVQVADLLTAAALQPK